MARTAFLTRRHALLAGASAPLIAGLATSRSARARTEDNAPGFATYNRFPLGNFAVTTLLSSTRTVSDPHSIFGLNVSDERFREVSEANFLPADRAQFFFTPTLVDTGSEMVLVDTGNTGPNVVGALEAAGHSADRIDTVVITHMHPDHIGGLRTDGAPTFPNARYVTGRVEYDAWKQMGDETFETKVTPLSDRFEFLEDGGTVASGITAMATFGHTPGHMSFRLESEGSQLVLIGDAANHPVWSVEHPDWEVSFDMDKAKAAETRHQLFGMLAAERLPFAGYHMPFPATGYVESRDDRFRYVPTSYQLMMG